jgi:hypothetical protein
MFEAEIVLGIVIVTWILYELYGRTTMDFLMAWSNYIRLAGGIVIILYLYWQTPAQLTDTLGLAKQLLTSSATASSSSEKEKRNVTGLMKKKVAADQEWRCGHCKAMLDATYEVDHIQALFQGGTNERENLVALCPNCHRSKTVKERLDSV